MFCQEPDNKDMEMSCSLKLIYELISLFSLICSSFVVHVTHTKIKMNVMHKLILQIIISEMVDEINILLGIISDSDGKLIFENYDFRMYVCFSQIFLSVFSCLWTLTASLFISIKLYDIIINKNKLFKKNSFLTKYVQHISLCVPLVLSYIFWAIHVNIRTSSLNKLSNIYVNKIQNNTQMIKLIFCWLNKELSISLACIVGLLIIGNLYFSIYKAYLFIKKMKDTILEQNEDNDVSNNDRIKNISQIQKILFLYPVITSIIWILFFLFIFFFNFTYKNKTSTGWNIVFCIFMALRQIIYTLIYFLSQKKLRHYARLVITFKTCCKNKIKDKKESSENLNIEMRDESINKIN